MADQDDKAAFKAKLKYWRENGAFGVSYQGGRDFFNRTTIREEQAKIVARGKANGRDLVPYHSVFPK